MKKIFFLMAILSAAFCLSMQAASVPVSDADLATKADVIVHGTVQSLKSDWTANKSTVVTLVTLKVEKYVKGAGGNEITVKIFGGTVGGVAVSVSDSPKFAANEEVVVFLRKGTEHLELVGTWRGKYNVIQTGGSKAVVQIPGGKLIKTAEAGKAAATAAVPLAEFITGVEKNLKK